MSRSKLFFLAMMFPVQVFAAGGRLGSLRSNNIVALSSESTSGGVTVYPATATINATYGISANTSTITNLHTSTVFADNFDVNTAGGFIIGSNFGEISFVELDSGGEAVQLRSPTTISGNIAFILPSSATTGQIMQATTDGSGDKQMSFTSTVSSLTIAEVRHSTITAIGNNLAIYSSTVSFTNNLFSTNTTNIGWSVKAAANQACNTTCTYACVFGEDTSVLGSFVDCADATADRCLCCGPQ